MGGGSLKDAPILGVHFHSPKNICVSYFHLLLFKGIESTKYLDILFSSFLTSFPENQQKHKLDVQIPLTRSTPHLTSTACARERATDWLQDKVSLLQLDAARQLKRMPSEAVWEVADGCGGPNCFGIPFWLVGEFTTHFRTYFSGWIGRFTGGFGFCPMARFFGLGRSQEFWLLETPWRLAMTWDILRKMSHHGGFGGRSTLLHLVVLFFSHFKGPFIKASEPCSTR